MQKRAIPTPPLAQQIIKYRLKVQNLPPVPTVHVGIHNVVKALYLLVFSCSISIYLTSTIPSIFFKCWRPISSSPASSNNKQQSTTKQTNVEIGPQVIGFIPHTQMNVRSGGTEKCAPPCFCFLRDKAWTSFYIFSVIYRGSHIFNADGLRSSTCHLQPNFPHIYCFRDFFQCPPGLASNTHIRVSPGPQRIMWGPLVQKKPHPRAF